MRPHERLSGYKVLKPPENKNWKSKDPKGQEELQEVVS
jgi:hypothetical protein